MKIHTTACPARASSLSSQHSCCCHCCCSTIQPHNNTIHSLMQSVRVCVRVCARAYVYLFLFFCANVCVCLCMCARACVCACMSVGGGGKGCCKGQGKAGADWPFFSDIFVRFIIFVGLFVLAQETTGRITHEHALLQWMRQTTWPSDGVAWILGKLARDTSSQSLSCENVLDLSHRATLSVAGERENEEQVYLLPPPPSPPPPPNPPSKKKKKKDECQE